MSEQDIKHINIELSEISTKLKRLESIEVRLTIIEEKVAYLERYKEALLK